eukprot:9689724-Lingulodinium_polyedra.AAC.1
MRGGSTCGGAYRGAHAVSLDIPTPRPPGRSAGAVTALPARPGEPRRCRRREHRPGPTQGHRGGSPRHAAAALVDRAWGH